MDGRGIVVFPFRLEYTVVQSTGFVGYLVIPQGSLLTDLVFLRVVDGGVLKKCNCSDLRSSAGPATRGYVPIHY